MAPELWRVPAPQGDEVLRGELGRLLAMDPESLTITASLRAAALTYARQASHIVLERPTFLGAWEVLRAGQARVEQRTWEEILAGSMPAGATVWVTSPARNPDGRTLTAAETTRLAELLDSGHPLVVNETYRWFGPAAARVPGADAVGTLHKLVGVGSRIGWVASPTYFDSAFPEMLGTTPSRVWQRAWGLFLLRGGFELLQSAVIDPCLAAAGAFRAQLGELGYAAKFDGPNALLPLAEGTAEDEALAAWRRDGYLVTAGRYFRCAEPAARVTFLGVAAPDAAAFARAAAASGLLWQEPPSDTGGDVGHCLPGTSTEAAR
jgi:DNA-binding transcriptional MocR family regulator